MHLQKRSIKDQSSKILGSPNQFKSLVLPVKIIQNKLNNTQMNEKTAVIFETINPGGYGSQKNQISDAEIRKMGSEMASL